MLICYYKIINIVIVDYYTKCITVTDKENAYGSYQR